MNEAEILLELDYLKKKRDLILQQIEMIELENQNWRLFELYKQRFALPACCGNCVICPYAAVVTC